MKIEDIDREFRELAQSLKEAQNAFRSGQFAKAEPLYKRALELVEKSYGEDHEDTIICLQNLGDTYYALKKYSESIPLLRRLLVVKEKQCGPAHGDVATVLFKLAKSYEKLGKVGESESFYRRALRVGEQAYGPSNSFVATILESFASMLRRAQIRLPEAESMEERIRDIREQTGSFKASKAMVLDNLSGTIPPDSEEGGDAVRTGDHIDTGRLRSLRSRGDRLAFQEKPPDSISSHKIVAIVVGLLIVLGSGGGVWYFLKSSESQDQSKTGEKPGLTGLLSFLSPGHGQSGAGQNANQPAKDLAYIAPDGLKRLFIHPDKKALMIRRDTQFVGTCTDDGAHIVFKADASAATVHFQDMSNAVKDDEGTILYSQDAPERLIVDKMKILAIMSTKFYRQTRHYPRDLNALSPAMQAIGYANPFSAKPAFPIKKQVAGADKAAGDIDLNDFTNLEAGIREFNIWNPSATAEPGIIEFFSTGNASDGESMYIRGTDREGKYLRASNPSSNFTLVLIQGSLRRSN